MCPCDEGADSATEQHRSNGKARGRRPGAEGVRQGVYGPVDDAAVETEEKAADGGDRGQHDDVDRSCPAWRGTSRQRPWAAIRARSGQLGFLLLVHSWQSPFSTVASAYASLKS